MLHCGSQHLCLTHCVLKASIHALNEVHCFSICLKWDSFTIFPLVCNVCMCAFCCFYLMALACLLLLACWVALSPALCDSCYPFLIWVISPLQSVLWSLLCRVIYDISGPMCVCEEESQYFNLLAKCMLMPVKCSIAELLKAFTPFNLTCFSRFVEAVWTLKNHIAKSNNLLWKMLNLYISHYWTIFKAQQ